MGTVGAVTDKVGVVSGVVVGVGVVVVVVDDPGTVAVAAVVVVVELDVVEGPAASSAA